MRINPTVNYDQLNTLCLKMLAIGLKMLAPNAKVFSPHWILELVFPDLNKAYAKLILFHIIMYHFYARLILFRVIR